MLFDMDGQGLLSALQQRGLVFEIYLLWLPRTSLTRDGALAPRWEWFEQAFVSLFQSGLGRPQGLFDATVSWPRSELVVVYSPILCCACFQVGHMGPIVAVAHCYCGL